MLHFLALEFCKTFMGYGGIFEQGLHKVVSQVGGTTRMRHMLPNG
jgi:hypothetical protein